MWEIILGFGVIFLILEIFIPTVFFINFALSCFLCAVLSLYISNVAVLIITFVIFSFILLYTIRPFFMKLKQGQNEKTGVQSTYIGKTATAVEEITSESGAISIYDERWQARSSEPVAKGQKVIIKSLDGLTVYVEKKEN